MVVGSGRNILWMIILLVLVTVPFWKSLLINFLSPPGFEYLKKKENIPGDRFVLREMKFSRSRNGIVNTTVSAAKAYGRSLNDSEIVLQQVEIVLLDKNEIQSMVTSSKGSYQPEKGEVILPGEFTFTSDNALIKGKDLYFDLKTGDYRIEGGVVVNLNPA